MSWKKISDYRSKLMGFAILIVVIFHLFEMVGINIDKVSLLLRSLYPIGKYGYIGVEIFLFLSGIGCFYSLYNNNSIIFFCKKRFIRILIPYIIIGTTFFIIKDIVLLNDFKKLILDFSGINLFLNNERTFWYVYLILGLYLIFPALYNLFSSDNQYIRNLSFVVIELFLIGSTIYFYYFHKHFFDVIQLVYTRIPIFIFGSYIGKNVKNDDKINPIFMLLFIISVFLIPVNFHNQMIMRFMNSVESIGLCFISVFLLEYPLKNLKLKFLDVLGKYSYEIYLLHVGIRSLLNLFGFKTYRIHIYLIVVVLTMLITPLIYNVSNIIHKKIILDYQK